MKFREGEKKLETKNPQQREFEILSKESKYDVLFCRGCSAKIVWGVSPSGKRTPFDFKKTLIMMDGGEVIWARVSHFVTCPKADEFRKKT